MAVFRPDGADTVDERGSPALTADLPKRLGRLVRALPGDGVPGPPADEARSSETLSSGLGGWEGLPESAICSPQPHAPRLGALAFRAGASLGKFS